MIISCLHSFRNYFVNTISFVPVVVIFFKPNKGLKNATLLITSYKAKQPVNVNTITNMNFTEVGISKGKMITEPRYKKIIWII